MDEKTLEYYRIEPLLKEVVTFRKKQQIFAKVIKQTYKAEISNLYAVESEVCESTSKLTDPNKWPIANKINIPEINVNEPLEEYKTIYTALDYLK